MKKTVYLILAALAIVVVWIIWSNFKTIQTKSSIDSTYFKGKISPTLGNYLADSNGMTLYTFSKDSSGVSTCTGACLAKWPVYGPNINSTGTLPSNVKTIKRTDGSMQFTWDGMPLYHYASDTNVGDTNGQGFGGFWYVVSY